MKVSLGYLNWFLRYSTFCGWRSFIFSQNQPSLGQSDPKKAGFGKNWNPLKQEMLNISRTNWYISMKLSVDLHYNMIVKWWWLYGRGINSMVATPTLPRAVLLSNTLQKSRQKIKIFQKFFLHVFIWCQKLQKDI